MTTLAIETASRRDLELSALGGRLASWRREVRRTLRQAIAVLTVLVLVGALHLMRWTGVILL